MSEAIETFRVEVDDSVLEDLRSRLARTRFPDQTRRGPSWDAGMPVDYLRELVDYWLEHVRLACPGGAAERVRALPDPDRRAVDPLHPRPVPPPGRPPAAHHPRLAGLDRRVPRRHPAAHRSPRLRRSGGGRIPRGRPFASGLRVLGAARTRGWDVRRIALAFIELMDRLGYARYGAQGGDWGAQVTTQDRRTRSRALCRHPPQHAGRCPPGDPR